MFLDIDIGGFPHNESLSHLLFHLTFKLLHNLHPSISVLTEFITWYFREVLLIPVEQLRASFVVLRFVIDVL